MPDHIASALVFFYLVVEKIVEQNGRPAADVRRFRLFHFDRGLYRRTESFRIVGTRFFADIIFVTAVAVWIAAESRDRYCSLEIGAAPGVHLNELSLGSFPTFLGDFRIFRRQVTETHAFRQRIDEHRTC